MRKGAGGRNSFSGVVATIFGATGWSGQFVASRLGKIGCQLIFPYRCDPYHIKHLKLSGDLGQTLFFPFHLMDDDSIRKCVKYSNVVINMIGAIHSTSQFPMWETNVEGAARIARLSKEMGVEKFIHISALNASHEPPEYMIPYGSEFLRSKAAGEDRVREVYPDAIIVRPSRLYGMQGEQFLHAYTYHGREYFQKRHDMWKRGMETVKMPLFGPNMADGLEKCVMDPTLLGQTLEFVGPYAYRFADLAEFIFRRSYKDSFVYLDLYRTAHGLSPWTQAFISFHDWRCQIFKERPHWNAEIVENTECVSDVLSGAPTLADIGVKNLKVFEQVSLRWLDKEFSKVQDQEQFWGDFTPPADPPHIPPLYTEEALKRRRSVTMRRPLAEQELTGTAAFA